MRGMNTRQPPAFIPTLTREVQEGEAAALKAAPLLIDLPLLDEEVLPPEAMHALPGKAVLKPTMDATISVESPVGLQPVTPAQAAPVPLVNTVAHSKLGAKPERAGIDDSASQAEQMRVRLVQRVDVIVQRRVREAAAAIALEHAHSLLQDLRPALENAIAEAVNEALALEVASRQGQR